MPKIIYDVAFSKAWKWLFFDDEDQALRDFKMRYVSATDYIEYTRGKGKAKQRIIEMTSTCFKNWAIERGALLIEK